MADPRARRGRKREEGLWVTRETCGHREGPRKKNEKEARWGEAVLRSGGRAGSWLRERGDSQASHAVLGGGAAPRGTGAGRGGAVSAGSERNAAAGGLATSAPGGGGLGRPSRGRSAAHPSHGTEGTERRALGPGAAGLGWGAADLPRAPGLGTLCHHCLAPESEPGPKEGRKKLVPERTGEEAWPEWSVAGLKFWGSSPAVTGTDCGGGSGGESLAGRTREEWEWRGGLVGLPCSRVMAALLELGVSWTQGGSAPLFPGPRFCDTLRLGLWSSQCMTELGPGRTFCTQRAQSPLLGPAVEHLPGSSRVGTGNSPCGTGLGWTQLWIGG